MTQNRSHATPRKRRTVYIAIGSRFGKLTVFDGPAYRKGRLSWMCRCECGRSTMSAQRHLWEGRVCTNTVFNIASGRSWSKALSEAR